MSFLQQVQGFARPTIERSRKNIRHIVHVQGERERKTHPQSVKAETLQTIVYSGGQSGMIHNPKPLRVWKTNT